MSIFDPGSAVWRGRMLSIFRIVVGLLFMEHGTQKLFGFPPGQGPHMALNLMSQFGLSAVLEGFGGLAILLGFLTRPVAFLLAGEMAVAYFQVHFPRSVYPIKSGGEPAVLFCFTYLYLMVAGAGPWSVDALIARNRTKVGSSHTSFRHLNSAA